MENFILLLFEFNKKKILREIVLKRRFPFEIFFKKIFLKKIVSKKRFPLKYHYFEWKSSFQKTILWVFFFFFFSFQFGKNYRRFGIAFPTTVI